MAPVRSCFYLPQSRPRGVFYSPKTDAIPTNSNPGRLQSSNKLPFLADWKPLPPEPFRHLLHTIERHAGILFVQKVHQGLMQRTLSLRLINNSPPVIAQPDHTAGLSVSLKCPGSINPRLSLTEYFRLFFNPLQFNFKLPNLPVEFRRQFLMILLQTGHFF